VLEVESWNQEEESTGMFYLLAISGILLARSVKDISTAAHDTEKVLACMTVEKPTGARSTLSDEASLTLLYEQFRRPIYSFTYRLLGSKDDADDVTQEVFVRACVSWNGLYEREHLSSWLYRIATNLCVDMLRRRKRLSWHSLGLRQRSDDYSSEVTNDDIISLLSDNGGIPEVAEREQIQATLAQMPTEYAVVLVLSAAQGVPYQEIAQIVGISPNAAATRISRAKKMFMDQYQRLGRESGGKRAKKR
jgi:RNA polymerase sigma-70 factor, ECF subfamily